MLSPFVIPLAVFLFVVVIVAIVNADKLHDKESESRRVLHSAQIEHQRRMQELQQELERIRREF